MTGRKLSFLNLKRQYEYMAGEIDSAIKRCLQEQQWILGPQVDELERAIAEYLGVRSCIGVSSGTEALVLALRALAIKNTGEEYWTRDDKIITTPFTFSATADAILRVGATPVFVDIDQNTYNIDVTKIREYLADSGERQVVGILPVHLYGLAADMDEIMKIAKEYNLFVLEDTAQALGGLSNVRKLGSIGNAGTFSFFPSKNLGGFGDGGMVAVNDEETAGLIRMLEQHGGRDKFSMEHIGYNARLDTIQAAVLLVKLKYLDEFNQKRRAIAEFYNAELPDMDILSLPRDFGDAYHVYHQYTIRVRDNKRDSLRKHLKDNGISTMVYYPVPLHKMKVFKEMGLIYGSLDNAEQAGDEVLSLPIEPLMKKEEMEFVVQTIKEWSELIKKI